MLTTAIILLFIVVLLGTGLAVLDMASGEATRFWLLAVLHGLGALAGFGCLVVALQGPERGLGEGTTSFGTLSAFLLLAAGLLGVNLLAARLRKRRLPGMLIGLHATVAVTGFVVLAAYYFA